jgi:NADH-quinone oxidoreductase subunit F
MDIGNFARRIEAGNIGGSARSLRVMNPLAEICGHICPAERLCQKECGRNEFSDGSVDIARLHAWVCREAGADGWDTLFPLQNGKKVAVVGAGPAGLTCAYFMARMGYRVDVFDKSGQSGGMMTQAIPSFRLPADVVERELEGMTVPGISFHYGKALGKEVTVQGLTDDYDAAFLAPGLWSGRRLDLPGMDKARVSDALKFLMAYRKNGKADVGDRVLIIGGGSVASDAAVAAHRCGAGKVTLVCLEGEDEMPCLESELVEMRKAGIEILNGWGPGEIVSESSMTFTACTRVFDEQGRFRPTLDASRTMDVEFDEIFMAVGQVMEPALAGYLREELGVDGPLDVDEETLGVRDRTGLYAGGDIIRGAGTVVQAAADGRRAARAMDTAIRGSR